MVRNEWGVPENALVFGAVGRLSMEKGYQIALQALRELTAALPEREMRLVLVGEGPLQGSIKIAAKEQGLEERVILPGFTNQPWNAYAGFDVFIMPSQNEGLPLALLEAMACGCCPIAMGVGGIPEVIIDSTLGWLVQSNDRAGFLAAMTAAAQSDTDTLAQMGRRARGHIVSRFDAENQYSALAHLVEMECGESPHRSKENDLARWLIRRHPR